MATKDVMILMTAFESVYEINDLTWKVFTVYSKFLLKLQTIFKMFSVLFNF